MLRLQDSVSVQPDWHCYFGIVLVYLQLVSQHPTVRPTHSNVWEDYFLRLFDLGDSSQSLRLQVLLANLESEVVPRLNGRLKWLLGLVMVVHLLVYLMFREELLRMRRQED